MNRIKRFLIKIVAPRYFDILEHNTYLLKQNHELYKEVETLVKAKNIEECLAIKIKYEALWQLEDSIWAGGTVNNSPDFEGFLNMMNNAPKEV